MCYNEVPVHTCVLTHTWALCCAILGVKNGSQMHAQPLWMAALDNLMCMWMDLLRSNTTDRNISFGYCHHHKQNALGRSSHTSHQMDRIQGWKTQVWTCMCETDFDGSQLNEWTDSIEKYYVWGNKICLWVFDKLWGSLHTCKTTLLSLSAGHACEFNPKVIYSRIFHVNFAQLECYRLSKKFNGHKKVLPLKFGLIRAS